MPVEDKPPRLLMLSLPESLFARVKEQLELGAKPERSFSDEEVTAFLLRHADILGSIVHFDELDTTDSARISQAQREEAAAAAPLNAADRGRS